MQTDAVQQKEIGRIMQFLEGYSSGSKEMDEVCSAHQSCFKELSVVMIHYMDVLADLDDWKDKFKKLNEAATEILEGRLSKLQQRLTLDGQADDEMKLDLVANLFKSEPSLSPRKPRVDKIEDKMKVLQEEVVFLRQHGKSLQAELNEVLVSLAQRYSPLT